MKDILFCGSSLHDLRSFSQPVKREAGLQLDRVQRGLMPDDWKPMSSIGPGVMEIRISATEGAFRVIYVAKLADIVLVLHCFQKKSQRTVAHDVALSKARYKTFLQERGHD